MAIFGAHFLPQLSFKQMGDRMIICHSKYLAATMSDNCWPLTSKSPEGQSFVGRDAGSFADVTVPEKSGESPTDEVPATCTKCS